MSIIRNYFKTEETKALGRNGFMRCIGVELFHYNDGVGYPFVEISPVNSKDESGQCYIMIPEEDLPELIAELQKLLTASKKS